MGKKKGEGFPIYNLHSTTTKYSLLTTSLKSICITSLSSPFPPKFHNLIPDTTFSSSLHSSLQVASHLASSSNISFQTTKFKSFIITCMSCFHLTKLSSSPFDHPLPSQLPTSSPWVGFWKIIQDFTILVS